MKEIGGKYIVERKLGEGASGKVYLVKHKDLNIRLALKILSSDFSSDIDTLESFKREAEVLFRFSHDGCVQLRDFGSLPDGRYFMATDFSEGATLRDLLSRVGRLDVEYTVSIIAKILDVLDAAHQIGIIHRDIKPENVMVERDFMGRDKIKVLDFGVAHLLELDVAKRSVNSEEVAGFAGTPYYMSPEQAVGEDKLDGRADLYSVGIMAYEMLVGKTPFEHEDMIQVLCMQVTQDPEPFPEGFFIPAAVEEVIFKALRKKRTERFQKAALFKLALVDALKMNPIRAERTSQDVEDEHPAAPRSAQEGKATEQLPAPIVPQPQPVEPLKAADTVKEEVPAAAPLAPEKQTILLLDDDPNLLNIASHIFSHAGYTVFTGTDVTRIHSLLFIHSVDLLITDVNMPDILGTKVCQLLKKGFPSLKIVLFSNVPERELRKLAKDSNADGYISKQTLPTEWLQYVASFLEE